MNQQITIDGRQLSYPGTGLSLVTAELIHAFQELGYAKSISVFIEKSFDPDIYKLNNIEVQWIPIDFKNRTPDYLGRLAWAQAVVQQLKYFGTQYRHFIPYLYNYGKFNKNVVLIPDLVYKIFPDYGIKDPNKPWYNLRGRLPIRPIFRWWEEQQVAKAECLVVYSEFVKKYAHRELGIPLEKMSLIPLAAPRCLIKEYNKNHNKVLQNYFKLPERFALYVGGFAVRKNIPMLLRTCGRVSQLDSTFKCVFIGLNDIDFIKNIAISKLMNNSFIKKAVIALPRLSYSDLADLYRLAEFTVYPSMSEGFGLPILEAAAANRLCLCGDNSSMQEIQIDPQYRVNSENEDAWVQRILFFWQNPEITKKAGETCGKLCQRYSWHKSAEMLWDLIQK